MVRAFILIKVEAGLAEKALHSVKNIPEIKEAHLVTGIYDIIAQVQIKDIKALGELVAEKIHNIEGMNSTVTCIVVA